ncbi:alpha/beta hydrolase [Acidaminobacterium chupaoyuni]
MILKGSVFSKVLGMDTGLSIVAPNSPSPAGEPRKVVYLLHGLCGSNSTWIDYSMLPAYAAGSNTVFILPEVARSFYTNMAHGFDYFRYITEELPEICQSAFRISALPKDTAVMGGSMGGHGALKCALRCPDRYGMCGAFAASPLFLKKGLDELRKNGMSEEFLSAFGNQLDRDFHSAFGDELVWKAENDPSALMLQVPAEKKPRVFMACGEEDGFLEENKAFSSLLAQNGYDAAFKCLKGNHTFYFFNEALQAALKHFELI